MLERKSAELSGIVPKLGSRGMVYLVTEVTDSARKAAQRYFIFGHPRVDRVHGKNILHLSTNCLFYDGSAWV